MHDRSIVAGKHPIAEPRPGLRRLKIAAAPFSNFLGGGRHVSWCRERGICNLARQLGCCGTSADQAKYGAAPVACRPYALESAGLVAGKYEVRADAERERPVTRRTRR